MDQKEKIAGFSKLEKSEKVSWIDDIYFGNSGHFYNIIKEFWLHDNEEQALFDNISENTLTNFILPYGVAPNFKINNEIYAVPMVIEESSVVAAAASAAKYWMSRGGFKATVLSTTKIGQVHFFWHGDPMLIKSIFPKLKQKILAATHGITENMQRRGGGIQQIDLLDLTSEEPGYYQLLVKFETCDSMGANFINTVLEEMAKELITGIKNENSFPSEQRNVDVLMAILSNNTPECLVRAEVSCPIKKLIENDIHKGEILARRFQKAVRVAHIDPFRAATHNKGIFNGVDAVVIATGNDFRAVEAAGHSYAAKDGNYKSLSNCVIEKGEFKFWLDIPLSIGTVGGLTKLHPLANISLQLLKRPSARQLMKIIASVGLAQNFAAVRSLITTGIQKGHMKMHLMNILHQFNANNYEKKAAVVHFQDKVISHSDIGTFIAQLREKKRLDSIPQSRGE